MAVARRSIDRVRRRLAQAADQGWVIARHQLGSRRAQAVEESGNRIALVTVNFHTTGHLRLLLASLTGLDQPDRLRRLVVVDHGAADGGQEFIDLLGRLQRVEVIRRRRFRHHGPGLRAGVARLDALDGPEAIDRRVNRILVCDPDVAFRRADTLVALGARMDATSADLCGDLRHDLYPLPEAQASFLYLRRSTYGDSDVLPFVHHGAPAWWLHRSLHRSGRTVANFPAYAEGYLLHEGRAAVRAAQRHDPHSSYASVQAHAHYMGAADGAVAKAELQQRWASLLGSAGQADLLDRLAAIFD